jgi:dephospho-CoA kinase
MNRTLPRIVGVCGSKYSGKDTVSNILGKLYGYENIKISEPLKNVSKILFNFTEEQVEGSKKDVVDPVWGITPRQVLQFIGTDIMQFEIQKLLKGQGRNFWVDRVVKKIESSDHRFVISDLRFLHEYEALKTCYSDIYIIRVNRSSCRNQTDSHISEGEFTKIPANVILDNDGTCDELEKSIVSLFERDNSTV